MEMIKAQLLRIQQQLAGLTATQKMLTASLVAIMLITLVWWSKSAGTSDFEPVVSSTMNADEASKVLGTLRGNGISEAIITNGQVMVPSDRKAEAVAMLAYNDVMPSQANPADEILKLIGPFDSNAKIQMTKDASLEGRLAQAFMSYFPGVQKALVVLNTKDDHRIGTSAEPSASVMITTKKGGQANAKLLTASITNIVSRAVSGLNPNKVGVVIDGKKMQSDSDELSSDDADARVINLENHYTDQIKFLVPPESMVLVKAELDDTTTRTETHAGNPETTVSKEKHSESQTSESTTSSGASAEPGAMPNASVTLASTGGSSTPTSTVNTEKNTSESEVYIGRTETQSEKMRGGAHLKTAAVRVPLSTFVSAYKGRHSGKDPSDADLDAFIKSELDTLCKLVVKGLNLPSAEGVAMGVYYDAPPAAPPTPELAGVAQSSLVSGYGKQVMLGVLAAISLFMVATMVKKGTPAPAIPIAASPTIDRGPMTLNGLGELAGMVNDESSGTLDGVEVDEQQLKNHRVVEQVSALVKDDPDAAAQLIKRWMSPT